MNVFIVAVCVNLLTLVNAQYVNMETLQKLMKARPRRSAGIHSHNVEISDPGEVIPISSGFYMEKPKYISKNLFKNHKTWAEDIYAILNKEEAQLNNTEVNVNTKIKKSQDEYLQGKILEAVQDLKRYRANQKQKSKDKFKARHIVLVSKSSQKEPVKKLLGRVFQGMNSGIVYKTKQKQPKKNTGPKNNKIFGELLRKILIRSLNNQPYQKSVQHVYSKPEGSPSNKKLLANILNSIQNAPKRESKAYLRPSMVIISPTPLHTDGTEVENNAKEETTNEDNGTSDLVNLRTRRAESHDIGSKKDAHSSTDDESGSSDYERNPGNPFTVHKSKYKQNWPYNHFMDGDHMNINPLGPQFGSLGPSGPELFFGRKWWYFNQDDYKPMG